MFYTLIRWRIATPSGICPAPFRRIIRNRPPPYTGSHLPAGGKARPCYPSGCRYPFPWQCFPFVLFSCPSYPCVRWPLSIFRTKTGRRTLSRLPGSLSLITGPAPCSCILLAACWDSSGGIPYPGICPAGFLSGGLSHTGRPLLLVVTEGKEIQRLPAFLPEVLPGIVSPVSVRPLSL